MFLRKSGLKTGNQKSKPLVCYSAHRARHRSKTLFSRFQTLYLQQAGAQAGAQTGIGGGGGGGMYTGGGVQHG